ncbi:claudin-8-like [Stigmatopora argus]
MAKGICEMAAMCLGLAGLLGAAAITGMPTWRVTAFVGENIVVMETRWEGLWMNCYRQANIRMQCKVYDSLLALPPDLQAARGLTCCALALSAAGLLLAAAGLRRAPCFAGDRRLKTAALAAAGCAQLLASVCVLVPVSWTGHVVIRDFYDPLLIDAQRRELGDALYLGWVTGAVLLASGSLFLCGLRAAGERKPRPASLGPARSLPGAADPGDAAFLPSGTVLYRVGGSGAPSAVYTPPVSSYASQNRAAYTAYTALDSSYLSHIGAPYTLPYEGTPSYQSSFRLAPQTPVFIPYKWSKMEVASDGGSSPSMYI